MGLLKNIIKKKDQFKQSDNKGVFHSDVDIATNYWIQRNRIHSYEPFLLYKFKDETDAVRALLAVECIKIAQDTEEIICIEELIYGYYLSDSGEYEVVLCGNVLSEDLFITAKKAFEENKGVKINELYPGSKPKVKSPAAQKRKEEKIEGKKSEPEKSVTEPVFVKEEKIEKEGKTIVYRLYKAPSAASALSFLEKNPVNQNFLVLLIKTPQGSFGRNSYGIYKVPKQA